MNIGGGIAIGGGINIAQELGFVTTGLQLHLDAGNTTSYPGTGSTWTDLIGSKTFTLYNTPTYSSSNGGYLNFVPGGGQYAASSTSLSSLSNWTVEVWHYYTGTNTGADPCIVTEQYPGVTGKINFSLGVNTSGGLQNGFWDGSWHATSPYTLTTNTWNHIIGTYDGTTIKLFVNNTLAYSSAYTGTSTTSQSGIVLMRRWDLGDYWGGRLSVVRIYNSALTVAQIDQNFKAQRARFGL
jgi:hypothetical protein